MDTTRPPVFAGKMAAPRSLAAVLLGLLLCGCASTVIGTAADAAIEVVKVPFKVGAAIIEVIAGDDTEEEGPDERAEEDN